MSNQFRQWLTSELKKRHYSQRAFAKTIGMSQPFLSRVLNGEAKPSVDFCIKIAAALGEPAEKVLRLAGILPASDDDPTLAELRDLIEYLPPSQRREALRYLRYLYQGGKDE